MVLHTTATVLEGRFTFFHPRHETWFLNKSPQWINRNQKEYKPRVIFMDMHYSMMSGDCVDITPMEEFSIAMVRDTVHFSLVKDHVSIRSMEFTVREFARAQQRREIPDKTPFLVRRMTDDDRFIVELEVVSHGEGRFDIVDAMVRGQKGFCNFEPI